MPLTVPCPKCATKLLAPDSAVGQRLRCPKCGSLAVVPDLIPAEEVPVVEATVVPPPPKPKPIMAEATDDRPRKSARRDDDDDDRPRKRASRADDDDDDRPRKKNRPRYADDDDDYEHDRPRRKKKQKSGGGNGALLAGVAVGMLVLLGCAGLAVYLWVGKKGGSSTELVKRTPVPPGWTQQSYVNDGVKVYLPKAPNVYQSNNGFGRNRPGRGGAGFGPAEFDPGADLSEADRFVLIQSGDWRDPVHIEMYVIRFPNRIPSSARDKMRSGPNEVKLGDIEMRRIKWMGFDGVEQTHPGGVLRVVYTDRHMIIASIGGPNGGRAKPEEEAGFFDNIEVTD
jgi:hypothetical protein